VIDNEWRRELLVQTLTFDDRRVETVAATTASAGIDQAEAERAVRRLRHLGDAREVLGAALPPPASHLETSRRSSSS
jgi:hypothetical protein